MAKTGSLKVRESHCQQILVSQETALVPLQQFFDYRFFDEALEGQDIFFGENKVGPVIGTAGGRPVTRLTTCAERRRMTLRPILGVIVVIDRDTHVWLDLTHTGAPTDRTSRRHRYHFFK